jgi:regulatory protein
MRCRAGQRVPVWPTPPVVSGNGAAGAAGAADPQPGAAGTRRSRATGTRRAGRAQAAGAGDGGVDPQEAARQICLRLLTAGPRTRAQLASALRRRQVPDEAAEAVLGRFAEVQLIDDAAFARAWVETRHHGRGLARRALSAELRQRGVAAEEIRAAVGSLGDADELTTARRLVAKRVEASRGRPPPARVRLLVGILARKGYPAGLAYQVVREALEQEGPPGLEAGFEPDADSDLDNVFGSDIAADALAGDEWTAG